MQYYEPNFLDEALVLLERFGADGHILAGGTRLGPALRHAAADTGVLINVKRIHELSTIAIASNRLRIGALATAAQLRSHPLVREHAPMLAAAAATMGARQLQTSATLGGNVCSGDCASDLSLALLAYEARCEVATPDEIAASVPVEQLLARGRRVMTPRDLLIAIEIPLHAHRFSYQRMTTRRGFEMALVAVALACRMDGDVIAQARIALAGAAPTQVRALAAEAVLAGRQPSPRAAREAGRAAADTDAQPESDTRASVAYRRALVATLTERAVMAMTVGAPHSSSGGDR